MNKEQQKKLLTEIMEADAKNGLYKTNNMAQQTDNNIDLEQGMKAAFDYFDKVSSFAKSQPVNEVKQTAVEWLDRWFRDNPEATHEEGNKALEQAKQMEKERRKEDIKIGYNQGYLDAQCNHVNDAENYANEQDYLNSKPIL